MLSAALQPREQPRGGRGRTFLAPAPRCTRPRSASSALKKALTGWQATQRKSDLCVRGRSPPAGVEAINGKAEAIYHCTLVGVARLSWGATITTPTPDIAASNFGSGSAAMVAAVHPVTSSAAIE